MSHQSDPSDEEDEPHPSAVDSQSDIGSTTHQNSPSDPDTDDPPSLSPPSQAALPGETRTTGERASDAVDITELVPEPDTTSHPLTETEIYELLRPACRQLVRYLDEQGFEIEETQWLIPPFAFTAILRDPVTNDLQYRVVEPVLTEGGEALRREIEHHLEDDLLFRPPTVTAEGAGPRNRSGTPSGVEDQTVTEHDSGIDATRGEQGGNNRDTENENDIAARQSSRIKGRSGSEGKGRHDTARATALKKAVESIINRYDLTIKDTTRRKLNYYLRRDWLNFGAIDPLMHDPRIEEISCDGYAVPVFVYHRDYESLRTNIIFEEAAELRAYVTKLAQHSGKDLSLANPLEGTTLPDGSRVELSFGDEVTARGSTFTIRRFKEEPFTPIDLIKLGTFSLDQLAYLWVCFQYNRSCLIAGGTASGKTTSLNACSLFIPPKSKIVSIEDTRELTLPHVNWIPNVTRTAYTEGDTGIEMMDLLRHGLRQRPEYIIVGEVRGEEAHALFQALNTGHTTYSTIHADSVRGVLNRLENPPMSVEKALIAELDMVIIQIEAAVDGQRVRRVNEIAELGAINPEDNTIPSRTVYHWDEVTDRLEQVTESRLLNQLDAQGRQPYEDIEHRKRVLRYLLENDITDYEDVAAVCQAYMLSPEHVRAQIEADDLNFEALRQLRSRAVGEGTDTLSSGQ